MPARPTNRMLISNMRNVADSREVEDGQHEYDTENDVGRGSAASNQTCRCLSAFSRSLTIEGSNAPLVTCSRRHAAAVPPSRLTASVKAVANAMMRAVTGIS